MPTAILSILKICLLLFYSLIIECFLKILVYTTKNAFINNIHNMFYSLCCYITASSEFQNRQLCIIGEVCGVEKPRHLQAMIL